MFNSIYTYIRKNKYIDEVILAFDSSNSWRYLTYPKYKQHRKIAKEKSDLDYKKIFKDLTTFTEDLKIFTPFTVLKVDRCEADDIIATLVLHTNHKFTIVSRDEDFIQLLPKARLYNPFTRKFVEEDNPKRFLMEKICIGQQKDNIPNIKTPNDWPEGKKRPSFGKKTFDKLYDDLTLENWIKDNDFTYNYKRNKKLIDFNEIPNIVKETILKRYECYVRPETGTFYKLFEKYEWQTYLDRIIEIERVMFKIGG
jgi:5'-3' exonuclease